MNIGIVVEYNPFHNGHLYQISEAKKQLSADIIIAVVSGDFVQRGEVSFLDKWEKTKAALNSGVDLVVELPLYYSIQNAEVFCKTAVKILDYLGTDVQVFGAETKEISKLEELIQIQNTDSYVKLLKKYLKNGDNYSVSHFKALEEHGLGEYFSSNNILAIEYLKTIKNENLDMKPYIIERKNTGYNASEINDCITSASNIRKMYFEKNLHEHRFVLPDQVYNFIENKNIEDYFSIKDKLYELFRYKILTAKKEELLGIYDIKEDILNRLIEQTAKNLNFENFMESMQTKNFSESRIKRSILNIVLNIKREDIEGFHTEYVRILGFNENGQKHLHKLIKQEKKLNIFTNWKDIEKLNLGKVKIEKNGFLIKELMLCKKEKLNSIIK